MVTKKLPFWDGKEMLSSYKTKDVTILLKNVCGMVKPLDTEKREKLIQEGKHYSEMLPIEYTPSLQYMEIYNNSLKENAGLVAEAVAVVCQKIIEKRAKNVVLVSLARAGIPIGILLKRYFEFKFDLDIKHYAISIIRGKGIDKNAMKYILGHHKAEDVLFVDGWIGKGAILGQLKEAIKDYRGVSSELAVLADPANIIDLCGTHEDILIPSSCLNCTVSGLISRTFLDTEIIGENDFHGALYYEELKHKDISYDFINAITKYFNKDVNCDVHIKDYDENGLEEMQRIAREFGISNINYIKPSIGETTRVLLRRIPWKILINEKYKEDNDLKHILKLAEEKNVEIMFYPLKNYKACGIIKNMADV